ncbi:PREDICTED: protein YLS3-like [Tarenaya hassleriana]|uniref:protein YLS3-like n=1 Tax=Tarenaya hassleriana TaxID=28532 RepID=UPI00053C5719|nr:PREDICTED: protein YLS3-like [Tarenaya hassleriana]
MHSRTHPLILLVIIMSVFLVGSSGDKAQDKEECTQELVGLATCLTYVQGQAKAPTPDCCSGLRQVLKTNKKCLCELIRDRNDPDLGLQINVSLALGLPSVCHAAADVTKCPSLLHLDPNSPEAQVFYQLGKGLNNTGPSSGPTSSTLGPTGPSPTPGSTSDGRATSVRGTSDGQTQRKRWLGIEIVAQLVLISSLITLN